MLKAEQETTIRWDQEERLAWLETSYPPQAAKWRRMGYPVAVAGRTRDGEPRRWTCKVPVGCVGFRRDRPKRIMTPDEKARFLSTRPTFTRGRTISPAELDPQPGGPPVTSPDALDHHES